MTKNGIPIFLLLLVPIMTGCSGYKIAALPHSPEIGEQPESERPVLREKMHARVHLKSGEVYTGEVVRVSDSEVTIGQAGNYGFEEKTYYLAEIEKIEVPEGSKVASGILSTTGIVALSAGAIILLALAFGSYN